MMYAPLQRRENAVQLRLEIGQPDDQYEQEADAVADQVVSNNSSVPRLQTSEEVKKIQAQYIAGMNASPYRQLQMAPLPSTRMVMRKIAEIQQGNNGPNIQAYKDDEEKVQMQKSAEEEEEMIQTYKEDEEENLPAEGRVQMKCEECENEEKVRKKPAIQRKEDGKTYASPTLTRQLQTKAGNGNALPSSVQDEIGGKMGADLSEVKAHTDKEAIQMNSELGAKAFTHGNDIYFNKGEYNPHSKEGKHLLAHELTHTVQQGTTDTIQKQEGPQQVEVEKKIALPHGFGSSEEIHIYYADAAKHAASMQDMTFISKQVGTSDFPISITGGSKDLFFYRMVGGKLEQFAHHLAYGGVDYTFKFVPRPVFFPKVDSHTFNSDPASFFKYTYPVNHLFSHLGVDGAPANGIHHAEEIIFKLSNDMGDLSKYTFEIKRIKTGYAAQQVSGSTTFNATEKHVNSPDGPSADNMMLTPNNTDREIASMDAPGINWTNLNSLPSNITGILQRGNFEEHVEMVHKASGTRKVDPYTVKWQVSVILVRDSNSTSGWSIAPGQNWVIEGHQQMPQGF